MRKVVTLSIVALCGCMSAPVRLAPELLGHTVPVSRDLAMSASARVLALHGFTLTPMDRSTGILQTQPIEVTNTWESRPVADRVDCGKDMAGVNRTSTNPVSVALGLIFTSVPTGTSLALRVTSTTYDQVARNMASTNLVAAGMTGTTPCELKADFVSGLFSEIDAAVKQ